MGWEELLGDPFERSQSESWGFRGGDGCPPYRPTVTCALAGLSGHLTFYGCAATPCAGVAETYMPSTWTNISTGRTKTSISCTPNGTTRGVGATGYTPLVEFSHLKVGSGRNPRPLRVSLEEVHGSARGTPTVSFLKPLSLNRTTGLPPIMRFEWGEGN